MKASWIECVVLTLPLALGMSSLAQAARKAPVAKEMYSSMEGERVPTVMVAPLPSPALTPPGRYQ